MTESLETVAAKLAAMPDGERAEVVASALRLTGTFRWTPIVGPQLAAYFCSADLLYYGGQGGGGKSSLLTGLALTAHRSSLLVRRHPCAGRTARADR